MIIDEWLENEIEKMTLKLEKDQQQIERARLQYKRARNEMENTVARLIEMWDKVEYEKTNNQEAVK